MQMSITEWNQLVKTMCLLTSETKQSSLIVIPLLNWKILYETCNKILSRLDYILNFVSITMVFLQHLPKRNILNFCILQLNHILRDSRFNKTSNLTKKEQWMKAWFCKNQMFIIHEITCKLWLVQNKSLHVTRGYA